MTDAKNDLTTPDGIRAHLNKRVQAALKERWNPDPHHPGVAQQAKDDALVEVLADIYRRLEALEDSPGSRLPPVERHQKDDE